MKHAPKHPSARAGRRRTLGFASLCAGAALGIVATTTVASGAPLSAPAAAGSAFHAASAPTSTPASFDAATVSARTAVAGAKAALASASAVTIDIAGSGLDLGIGDASIDVTGLQDALDRLSNLDVTPLLFLPNLTDQVVSRASAVSARVETLRTALQNAQAAKAAADAAAAAAAAEAQREADAAAAAQAQASQAAKAAATSVSRPAAVGPVDPSSAQGIARQMAASEFGWGDDQFACLVSLWNRESGWNYQAYNSSSGAGGIPQALPASKMASAGADWATNPATQILWGLRYINGSYGSPCSAWDHSESTGWY